MIHSPFLVDVVQGTIAVYQVGVEGPFNDWSKAAYAQGFSWRVGSVSFWVPEDGPLPVTMSVEKAVVVSPTSTRAIVVPFHVPAGAKVEVSGIYEKPDRAVDVPEGDYSLLFELGRAVGTADHPQWCKIAFARDGRKSAEILRLDRDLTPRYPLVMDGKPA